MAPAIGKPTVANPATEVPVNAPATTPPNAEPIVPAIDSNFVQMLH